MHKLIYCDARCNGGDLRFTFSITTTCMLNFNIGGYLYTMMFGGLYCSIVFDIDLNDVRPVKHWIFYAGITNM